MMSNVAMMAVNWPIIWVKSRRRKQRAEGGQIFKVARLQCFPFAKPIPGGPLSSTMVSLCKASKIELSTQAFFLFGWRHRALCSYGQ